MYSDFELQGIDEETLKSKAYDSVCRRLQLEETNASLSAAHANSANLPPNQVSSPALSLPSPLHDPCPSLLLPPPPRSLPSPRR